ncbi:MAG: UDP-galactopyranose mutase [Crenarchaeota archaeon]|nr:MAG: UDP-galactopyranose mutase [Thermoproteota archaeon]
MKYDYLVVGAGIYGAVFAERIKNQGKTALVIDKRPHIAGNCYTKPVENIHVHQYGPHIFHTNKKEVWDYLNKFTQFNSYRHTGKASYQGRIFSFPINLMTFQQIWGIKTPAEATQKLQDLCIPIENPKNMEEWCLSKIGPLLYEMFVKHYSIKQWKKHPKDLPASIVRRIPIRLTFNEDYYEHALYQGIPVGGYTNMIKNMLDGVSVELGVDFNEIKSRWKDYAQKLVYCGPIDQYFDYEFGELEYRSLRWDTQVFDGDYQGCSIINYTGPNVGYTRCIEHKHFEFDKHEKTVVSWEHPTSWKETKEPYYPINDEQNNQKYQSYKALKSNDVLISGRLGKYKYLDMDDCVALALKESANF